VIQAIRQVGPLRVAQELGVETNHLDREVNLVAHALSRSMAAAEQLKVFDVVVTANPIDVVDGFFRKQLTTDLLFHDESMFKTLPSLDTMFVRKTQTNISLVRNIALNFTRVGRSTALMFRQFISGTAFRTAKFAASSNCSRGASGAVLTPFGGNGLSANNAGLSGRFSLSNPSAGTRAVQRVLCMGFSVGTKFTRIFMKQLPAFVTVEANRIRQSVQRTVRSGVFSIAKGATEFSGTILFKGNTKSSGTLNTGQINGGKFHSRLLFKNVQIGNYHTPLSGASRFNLGVA